MAFPLPARTHLPAGTWIGPAEARVVLSYDERFLRRKRLETEAGEGVLVDLPATTNLAPGDALQTDDGRLVEVLAASEPVLRVTGPDLARLAWHIGNRHTPCEVAGGHLVIRQDHVLEAMLVQLGARVERVLAPFRPEGGAYGHGRTLGHDHGPHGFPDAHGHG
jgi:urease accessory protein